MSGKMSFSFNRFSKNTQKLKKKNANVEIDEQECVFIYRLIYSKKKKITSKYSTE